MLRPLSLLPALVAVAATVGVGAPPAASASAAQSRADEAVLPLAVTIDSMSPATVPENGRITVKGAVTNVSEEPWSTISIFPFVSEEPMRTRDEIAAATLSDPSVPVGDRVVTEGAYDTLDELQPGQTLRYTVKVRAQDLAADASGVYWFGIHALGISSTSPPGDATSDGKARTFLPRLGGSGREVKTALVMPLRTGIDYEADGSIADPGAWAASLSADGALSSMVALGDAADGRPLTWLLDPAIPDAVARLEAGNPARSLGATVDPEATEDPDALLAEGGEPSASATPDPDAALPSTVETADPESDEEEGEEGGGETEEPTADEIAAGEAATAWLARLRVALGGKQVLALPYGDLDVAAAADLDQSAYVRARRRAGDSVQPWGLPTGPALSGPRGLLSLASIRLADADETLLGTDLMVPGLGTRAPTVATVEGRRILLVSSAAAAGGPGPDDRLAGVAVRQRILAEAAVRRLSPTREPLVVMLPAGWEPDEAEEFFAGLDQDWLDLTTVADVADEPATALDPAQLDYPRGQTRHQLEGSAFDAADALTRAGTTLQYLLTRNDTVAAEVSDQALTTLGYAHRANVATTRSTTALSRAAIQRTLDGVRIEGPQGVTLSSGSGRFSATLENTLDEPVTVRVRALAEEPDITITMAEEDVQLPPNSRRSVLLTAATERQGIHRITLQVTDLAGTTLGGEDELPIRAAQVSDVIWLIIGTGAALLFSAIGVRLVRRVRRARRTSAADETETTTAEAESAEEAPAPT